MNLRRMFVFVFAGTDKDNCDIVSLTLHSSFIAHIFNGLGTYIKIDRVEQRVYQLAAHFPNGLDRGKVI